MKNILIAKNTYGYSAVLKVSLQQAKSMSAFAGSSLNRKNSNAKVVKSIPNESFEIIKDANPSKLRSMSSRTKSKIRKKLIAWSRNINTLTFVTLTFCNIVEDKQAVKILKNFLDYAKKFYPQFQYLWVAERQAKNKSFPDNIHFHLVTNIQWNIRKFWDYWLRLQARHGILPRDLNYKPSSAFDVRYINIKEMKKIQVYITKYITKNKAEFDCQVWNCSKKVSQLYTDFYSGFGFIQKMEELNLEPLKTVPLEHCTLYFIPYNENTIKEYESLKLINKKNWQ